MLAGYFNFQTYEQKNVEERSCPWTIVFTKPAVATLNMCFINYSNSKPAEIDWGDGSAIQQIAGAGSGDSFEKFSHTYASAELEATVKVRMNGPLDLLGSRSWFNIGDNLYLTDGSWLSVDAGVKFNPNKALRIDVLDWNADEMYQMLCLNSFKPITSPFSLYSPYIKNHLLHELKSRYIKSAAEAYSKRTGRRHAAQG